MAQFNRAFGANSNYIPPDFGPMPEGEYTLIVEKTEKKTSAAFNEYLNVQLRVMEPSEYKNRVVFHIFNLWNQNDKAREMAEGELELLLAAADYNGQITDSSQLIGLMFKARLKIQQNVGYEARNVISGYILPQDGNAPSQRAGQPTQPNVAGPANKQADPVKDFENDEIPF